MNCALDVTISVIVIRLMLTVVLLLEFEIPEERRMLKVLGKTAIRLIARNKYLSFGHHKTFQLADMLSYTWLL